MFEGAMTPTRPMATMASPIAIARIFTLGGIIIEQPSHGLFGQLFGAVHKALRTEYSAGEFGTKAGHTVSSESTGRAGRVSRDCNLQSWMKHAESPLDAVCL